jgi:hypothetical protein
MTDQAKQEKIIQTTWMRLNLLSTFHHRRVIAALNYFHVACRLKTTGNTPWEFMGEVVLNLAKILEALFPPTGNIGSINAARDGLKSLGYSEAEIERDYIPAIVLRNKIDSAHISLFDFPREKLDILFKYTDRAESKFRTMLGNLISKIQEGEYKPMPYGNPARVNEAIDIVNKIESFTENT